MLQWAVVVGRSRSSSVPDSGSASGGSGASKAPSVTLKQFIQVLVRVALLVMQSEDEGMRSLIHSDAVDLPRIADFVRRFIQSRILPLSLITTVEQDSVLGLDQPDVVLCLSKQDNKDFLKVAAVERC